MLEPMGSSPSFSQATLSSSSVKVVPRPRRSPSTSLALVGRAPTATCQVSPQQAAQTLSTGKSVAERRTASKSAW